MLFLQNNEYIGLTITEKIFDSSFVNESILCNFTFKILFQILKGSTWNSQPAEALNLEFNQSIYAIRK